MKAKPTTGFRITGPWLLLFGCSEGQVLCHKLHGMFALGSSSCRLPVSCAASTSADSEDCLWLAAVCSTSIRFSSKADLFGQGKSCRRLPQVGVGPGSRCRRGCLARCSPTSYPVPERRGKTAETAYFVCCFQGLRLGTLSVPVLACLIPFHGKKFIPPVGAPSRVQRVFNKF